MIPKLFAATATRFTSNGLGRLSDAVECTVTEERNGPYELYMRYPITGKHYADISISKIIYAVPADGKAGQPFRIYRIEKPLNGIVSIYAEHISYQLNHIPVMPFTATSCAQALTKMVAQSAQANPFTVWTDKTVAGNFNLAEPRAFRAILGGTQGSILDVYGKGEYEFDGYTVKLHLSRGIDTGVVLRYGKNITDLTQDENIETTITGICPFWRDQTSGTTVTLPEYAVWSSTAANYPYKRTAVIDFSSDFQTEPTVEQLRQRSNKYIEDNDIGIPKVSLDVQFVPLWQMDGVSTGNPTRTLMLPATVDGDTLLNLGGTVSNNTVTLSDAYWDVTFEDYKVLERLHLCDTLTIRYDKLGVDATAKIVKTTYNVLADRYDSLEVGDARTNLANQIAGVDDTLQNLRAQMQNERSTLQAYVDHQTELITGGLGGYVVFNYNADGQPEELLIMDSPDMTTAVNVIRMNQNGIGFSRTGYNGPFTSAWTIDGVFNADFIGAGSITANIIKGGLLTDEAGKNYWDLVSGDLSMSGEFSMSTNALTANIGDITYTSVNNDGSSTEITTQGFKVEPTSGATYSALAADGKSYIKTSGAISRNGGSPQRRMDFTSTSSGGGRWVHAVTDGAFYERFVREVGVGAVYALMYDHNAIGYKTNNSSWTYGTGTATEWPADPGGSGGIYVPYSSQPNFVISANRIAVNKNSANGSGQSYTPSIWIDATYQKINGKTLSFASSSSERFKHDIAPLDDERDPHKLLDLEPKQFVYNEGHPLQYADMDGQTLPGFIAEDVERVYPSAVIHDPDGNVESWDERRIIPGMLALIQEQEKRIARLEKIIERMEHNAE
jgi:phage minor structural protein